METTENLRIQAVRPVATPALIQSEIPLSDTAADTVATARREIQAVLAGVDDRLLVIVGPCSIHDPVAALDYAKQLSALRADLSDDLLIVMRVYFEKPRTTVGWKGLINDPNLDGTFDINAGLRAARKLLLSLNESGIPAGVEFLDILTPQYLTDLVAWGAIGARTTESQLHREMVSGLSCPVGFKNGTAGSMQIAVDAVKSARSGHRFLSLTSQGMLGIFETKGNDDTHVILRGGSDGPNFSTDHIDALGERLEKSGLPAKVMVDCSHANSQKQHRLQAEVAKDIASQLSEGEQRIIGVMIESHLKEGNQKVVAGEALTYGQSITDACLGIEDTATVLRNLAGGVHARRTHRKQAAA